MLSSSAWDSNSDAYRPLAPSNAAPSPKERVDGGAASRRREARWTPRSRANARARLGFDSRPPRRFLFRFRFRACSVRRRDRTLRGAQRRRDWRARGVCARVARRRRGGRRAARVRSVARRFARGASRTTTRRRSERRSRRCVGGTTMTTRMISARTSWTTARETRTGARRVSNEPRSRPIDNEKSALNTRDTILGVVDVVRRARPRAAVSPRPRGNLPTEKDLNPSGHRRAQTIHRQL